MDILRIIGQGNRQVKRQIPRDLQYVQCFSDLRAVNFLMHACFNLGVAVHDVIDGHICKQMKKC